MTETSSNDILYGKLDQVVDNVIKIPGHPAWIVLCGYAIGETSIFCALADAFVRTHGHGVIIVVTPKHESVAKMYAHRFLKIIVMSDDWMRFMLSSGYIPPDRFELDKPINGCWIGLGFSHSDGVKYLSRYSGRGGIGMIDMMRFCLRLPWNARIDPPHVSHEWEDEAWQIAKNAGVSVGRSVLLCPINNSAKRYPDIFWETVAIRLKKNGYKVFTNMGGLNQFNGLSKMPVNETIPVNLPIHLVMPFLNFAGRGISGANGMLLFIMLAGFKSFQMTQLIGGYSTITEDHSSLGYKQRDNVTLQNQIVHAAIQYCAPELCLKTSLEEYLIPYEASREELMDLAVVVADQNKDDSSCIKRYESNGRPFVEEHADWLRDLV